MRFHSAISDEASAKEAASRLISETREGLGGKVDVVFLFLSPHHLDDADMIIEKVWLELDPQALIGCSAESVIGGDFELERHPGMSLLAGNLPGARLHPFHVSDWDEMLSDSAALSHRIGLGPQTRAIIGFGDPYSTPVSKLLPAIDQLAAGAPLIGGMASGGRIHGEHRLFHNDCAHTEGFVGLSIAGPVEVQTVVSQGCRPVGRPLVITKARENIIEQLGGRTALHVLREMVDEMPEVDKELLAEGLFFGQAITEYRECFGRGDFLIRNVIGIDEAAGSIAVAEYVRPHGAVSCPRCRYGQRRFIDASRSPAHESCRSCRRFLFSCNGRGTKLFDETGHDIRSARQAMPKTPVAGFFAAGEFGPVGGRNFLHGHTASFAMFRAKDS